MLPLLTLELGKACPMLGGTLIVLDSSVFAMLARGSSPEGCKSANAQSSDIQQGPLQVAVVFLSLFEEPYS